MIGIIDYGLSNIGSISNAVNKLNHSYKIRKSNWEFEISLLVGDANLDDSINVLDIIYLVNEILYTESDPSVFNLYKV